MNMKSFFYCFIISIFVFTSCSETFDEASSPYKIAKENNFGVLNGNKAIITDAQVSYLTDSLYISKDNYIGFSFTLIDNEIAHDTANIVLNISTDLLNKTIDIEDTYTDNGESYFTYKKDDYQSYFSIEEYLTSYGDYFHYKNATGSILISPSNNYNIYTITISKLIEGNKSISCSVAVSIGE